MTASLIKFVQGASTPPPGEALIGVLTTNVTASNASDLGVSTWTWTTIDVPPGSAVPLGVVAITPSFTFAPDVRGGYHLELRVTDGVGAEYKDHRVFQVPEVSGFLIPPFDALAPALNFSAQLRGWAKSQEELLRYLLAKVSSDNGDLILASEGDSGTPVFVRQGARVIDLATFPATIGALARKVRFGAILQNTLHSATFNAEAQLYDYTHAVAITGSTLVNSAEPDRSIAKQFLSGVLTTGVAAGNMRTDVATLYQVLLKAAGAPVAPTERAVIGIGFVRITYE